MTRFNNSLHFQLDCALLRLGVITAWWLSTCMRLPSYAFIAKDYTTQAALLHRTTKYNRHLPLMVRCLRSRCESSSHP